MSARLKKALGAESYMELKPVLDVIVDIVNKDLNSSYSNMRKDTNFEHPAWTYEQAAFIGEQRTLTRVIELLTVKAVKSAKR